jgi:hypothetical protein
MSCCLPSTGAVPSGSSQLLRRLVGSMVVAEMVEMAETEVLAASGGQVWVNRPIQVRCCSCLRVRDVL